MIRRLQFCLAMIALFSGCAIVDRTGNEDLDRFVEYCREVAMSPVEKEDPDDPMTKVDWMVYPCSATTQEFKKDFKVVYADATHLSYYAEEFSYLGGAHGSTKISVGTFDRRTGRRMHVSDFVPSEKHDALARALHDGAVKQLGGKDHLQGEVTVIENFYLAKDGLHFVYNEYEIACYADGAVEVVVDPARL